MTITVCKFSKICRGSMPPDPLKSFLLIQLLKITVPGKNCARKSDEIWYPLPEKNFEYAPDMKHFERTYLRPYPGLNVFVFR